MVRMQRLRKTNLLLWRRTRHTLELVKRYLCCDPLVLQIIEAFRILRNSTLMKLDASDCPEVDYPFYPSQWKTTHANLTEMWNRRVNKQTQMFWVGWKHRVITCMLRSTVLPSRTGNRKDGAAGIGEWHSVLSTKVTESTKSFVFAENTDFQTHWLLPLFFKRNDTAPKHGATRYPALLKHSQMRHAPKDSWYRWVLFNPNVDNLNSRLIKRKSWRKEPNSPVLNFMLN